MTLRMQVDKEVEVKRHLQIGKPKLKRFHLKLRQFDCFFVFFKDFGIHKWNFENA